MGSICGIYYKNGKNVEDHEIKKMLSSLNHWGAEHQCFEIKENVAFGKLSLEPEKRNSSEFFYTAATRLENVTEEQFVISVKKQGENSIKNFYGDFAFGLYEDNKLIIGRDHFGIKPIFYYDSEELFAFASEMKGLFAIVDIHKKLSEEWLLDLLANSISEKHVTPYKEIKRVRPGHVVKITPEITEEIKYWDLNYAENHKIFEEEAIKEFRKLLIKSVENRSKSKFPVGSELSGGIDSSVVASIANDFCKKQNTPFFSLSHINPDFATFPFKDERDFIKQVVEHSKIENSLFVDAKEEGILETIDKGISLQDGPTQQRFYEFSDALYETASKHNIHTLLSGFGGDEMVSSQTPGYFHELAKQNWVGFLSEELKRKQSLPKKLKSIFNITVSTKLPGIYKTWISMGGNEKKRISENFYKNNALKNQIIRKYDLVERALPKSRFPNQPSVHERQYQRVMHPHLSQRMEYSAIAALHHKMEYSYPLLDVNLVEFYYSLPTRFKINGETRRYIYRKSIEGIVPESIRWRNDKSGATIPSVQKRFLNDFENIRKFIIHCKKNGIGEEYFDFDDMLQWQVTIKNRTVEDKIPAHQGQFFNYLMLIRFLDKF